MESERAGPQDDRERRPSDDPPVAPASSETADGTPRPDGGGASSADRAAVNQERAFESGEENPV